MSRLQHIRLEGDPRVFNIDRDLAYLGPQLIAEGLIELHSARRELREPWLREFLLRSGVTDADLDDAVPRFLSVLERVIQDHDPGVACPATGFDQVRPEIQLVLYAKLGQIFLAGYYTAVKESSEMGSDPPLPVQKLVKQASRVVERFLIRAGLSRGELSRSADGGAGAAGAAGGSAGGPAVPGGVPRL